MPDIVQMATGLSSSSSAATRLASYLTAAEKTCKRDRLRRETDTDDAED
jgi:hypothetical protein